MTHPADRPRACVRCHQVKPAARFPERGPTRRAQREQTILRRGTARICWSCLEGEAWALHDAGFRPRPRIDWTEDGVRMRRCSQCREAKPYVSGFYATGRKHPQDVRKRYRRCKECMKPDRAAANRRRMAKAENRQALNAKLKDRRANDPDYRRRANETSARWRAKRSDEQRERERENARISHRLKRELQGVPMDQMRSLARVARPDRLPAAPLAALVSKVIDHRTVVAEAINEPAFGLVGRVCQDLGVNERTYRRWRTGEHETVAIGTAESIMLAADVDVSDVYSPEDYPEVARLFSGVEA